MEEAVR